jgi:hypothetical protein
MESETVRQHVTDDDTEDEGAEIIYCRYGQCADRTVPCQSCVRIVVNPQGSCHAKSSIFSTAAEPPSGSGPVK